MRPIVTSVVGLGHIYDADPDPIFNFYTEPDPDPTKNACWGKFK
jgi:hypothetical protein